MAIDRTAFNALVDDDGTGTTGTPWEKARIAGVLLDPIDAEIARIDGGIYSGIFTPSLEPDGGGAPAGYVNRAGMFTRIGHTVYVAGRITVSGPGSMAGNLYIGDLPWPASSYTFQGGLSIGHFGGLIVTVGGLSGFFNPNFDAYALTYVPAAGGVNTLLLNAAHIGGLDLIFGGFYQTD